MKITLTAHQAITFFVAALYEGLPAGITVNAEVDDISELLYNDYSVSFFVGKREVIINADALINRMQYVTVDYLKQFAAGDMDNSNELLLEIIK